MSASMGKEMIYLLKAMKRKYEFFQTAMMYLTNQLGVIEDLVHDKNLDFAVDEQNRNWFRYYEVLFSDRYEYYDERIERYLCEFGELMFDFFDKMAELEEEKEANKDKNN